MLPYGEHVRSDCTDTQCNKWWLDAAKSFISDGVARMCRFLKHCTSIALLTCLVAVGITIAHLDARADGPVAISTSLPLQPIFRLTPEQHPYDPDWIHVQRILNRKCVGCHRPDTDRTNLTNYSAVMAAKTEAGLPVVQVGNRLALFYDAPEGNSTSHMKRNIGLAWMNLPLAIP